MEWRRGFIQTFVERDLPQLGITVGSTAMRRYLGAGPDECFFLATHAGDHTFALQKRVRAVSAVRLLTDLPPLR